MNMKQTMGVALAAAVLGGCATTRSEPDANGVTWPAPDASYLKEGAFVAPAQFPLIKPGLSKDQVQLVLGLPHFREGLAGVRDWNYRFNFHSGDGVLSCQYQVQYDDEERVTGSYWRNPECGALVQAANAPAAATVPAAAQPATDAAAPTTAAALPRDVTVLFAFGRAQPLSIQARHDLAALAAQLKQREDAPTLTVTGHTDRVGEAQDNQALAQARAQQVAEALIAGGIAADRIQTVARGSAEPVSQCPEGELTPELIQCLQPDRRAVVTLSR